MRNNSTKYWILLVILFSSFKSNATYNWVQKADFGGGNREQSISFSIGNYGYAGTGKDPAGKTDFWQYDPSSDTWSQKMDYPGQGRYGMAAFSIGNFGYVGTGWTGAGGAGNQFNDFWQYDPAANTWTQKADFGGSARYSAVGFSIGNKGYIGLGFTPLKKDFWEYDPSTDTWTQKTDFPFIRQAAIGFSIGNKGYVGTGRSGANLYNDFFEYDPATDVWTQKTNVPGLGRLAASAFAIGSYGFVGMGSSDTTYMTDFYRYEPASDTWTTIANIGGHPRYASFTFAIGSNGYVGTGSFGGIVTPTPTNDFWCLEPCTGALTAWTQKADFGGGNREQSISFSIGNFGYAGTGRDSVGKMDFWQYDPATDTWSQKMDYPGQGRYGLAAFSIGNFGYAGTGWIGAGGAINQFNDFWQYDPSTNSWTQKANFGGSARYSAVGFSIGNKGYIGLGFTPLKKDFWEYDPSTDTWSQKTDFPFIRQAAIGFSIGNKGYVGTGINGSTLYNDFYEYDPGTDSWTQKSNVPGLLRVAATAFSIGGYGYVGMGASDTTYISDFHMYNPVTDQWSTVASIGGQPRYASFCFSIGNYGYVGAGSFGGIVTPIPTRTFWRFENCDGTALNTNDFNFENNNISVSLIADHDGLKLNYDVEGERNLIFILYDCLGKIIVSKKLHSNSNSLMIPINLHSQLYIYSLSSTNRVLRTGKVMVN